MKRRLPVSLSSGRRLRLGGLGRLGRLLAVCFIFAAVPPIAASGAFAATDLSAAGRDAYSPQIAVSSDGTRETAVWKRSNGSKYIVQSASATIAAGVAAWGAVTDLSAPGQDAEAPQIALSSDGTRATAVWYRWDGSNLIVQSASATIAAGAATWGAVTNLSMGGQHAYSPQIALSSDGTRATAIWHRYSGVSNIVQSAAATISGGTATWGAVTDLSVAGHSAGQTQIALSSDGTRATAVWYRSDGSNYIVQSASATIAALTATWSAAADLSLAGQDAGEPQIAVSSDGARATAVWSRSNGTNYIAQSKSATVAAGVATWGAVTDLSLAGQHASTLQIAVSSDGTLAIAVWYRSNGTNDIVQSVSATVAAGTATWSAVADLSAAGQSAGVPQIALSSDGTRARAVWYRSNGSNAIVQAVSATVAAGVAAWGAVADLSAAGQSALAPQVAMSSDGTWETAVWYRSNGTNTIVQSESMVSGGGGDGGGEETPVVVVARGAYCSVSGNTWVSGRAMTPNTFLNLELGQSLVDSHYLTLTLAIFVVGKGLTCDLPASGLKRDGYATGNDNVPAGLYALYRA